MIRNLCAVALSADEAAQAFPLARALVPELDLPSWLAFVRKRAGGSATRGLIGVRDDDGYFHGLYGYEVRYDLTDGATLDIDLAIAMELLDRAGAAAVLMDEIQERARRLDCNAVHVHLKPHQRRLRRWFEAEGHSLQSVTLAKPAPGAGT